MIGSSNIINRRNCEDIRERSQDTIKKSDMTIIHLMIPAFSHICFLKNSAIVI